MMACYVDPIFVVNPKDPDTRRRGVRWCHMIADTHEELIAMAEEIGHLMHWIQKEGLPDEHFDLTPPRRALAVKKGAIEISGRELAERIAHKRKLVSPPAFEGGSSEGSNGRKDLG